MTEDRTSGATRAFPPDFLWGVATSAYQIEGAVREDGRGESIWDRFVRQPHTIVDGDSGDTACDHYHRWEEDLDLLVALGVRSYRFSIAWPRIQPEGRGAAHSAGIAFYDRLVDGLLARGIRPFPTLYHWDLPQALEDAGGWPARDTAERFADYAAIMAGALGDRVRVWGLFNEPRIFTMRGYLLGIHAPGRRDTTAYLRSTHVVNLAQGLGFRAIKACIPDAEVGSAYNMCPSEPATAHPADVEAARRAHGFFNAWFLAPALQGQYPDVFERGVPYDTMDVRAGDMETVRVPLDYVGINLYMREIVRAAPESPLVPGMPVRWDMGTEGPRTDWGWEVWPRSLSDMVLRVSRDHGNPIIEITENGAAYHDEPDHDGRIRDVRRIAFHRDYLAALAEAIAAGARVRSYHAWSLMDNFEWAAGYRQRFGLVYVDFPSGARTLKASGRWYARVAATGRLDQPETD